MSLEEYVRTYCQEKRIRQRYAVYVTPEIHDKLKEIAFMFRFEHHTTASSLANAIITNHMETHRELLNDEYRRFHDMFRRDLESYGSRRSDETDSESCPDDDSEEQ